MDELEPLTLELRGNAGNPAVVFTKGFPSSLEFEVLIADLAQYRALISPPVPRKLPESTAVVLELLDNPETEVARGLDGSSKLFIRHPGLGWLGFHFTAADRDRLIEALRASPTSRHLILSKARRL